MIKLKYKYYAVNSDNKIVNGFNTQQQAVKFSNIYRYKVYSYNSLHNKNIEALDIQNWNFSFIEKEK